MTVEDVLNIIDKLLSESDENPDVSRENIKLLDDFIQYNKRLYGLNEKELNDFHETMIDGFTEKEMEFINNAKPEDKNHYIDMYSRSKYFKQCAWMSYLHGEKPFIQN